MGLKNPSAEKLIGTVSVGGIDGDVAALNNGKYIAVWTGIVSPLFPGLPDTALTNIAGRLLDAGGKPLGQVFQINTTAPGQETLPEVTALTNGGFVVVWHDITLTSDQNEARAQVFNAAGRKVGAEITLNADSADHQSRPAITALKNGGFYAVWEDERAPVFSGDGDIYAQEFTAAGQRVGPERVLLDGASASYIRPQVAELNNGRIVTVADDLAKLTVLIADRDGGNQVSFRIGDRVGTPQIAALDNGGFVIAYETDTPKANGNLDGDATVVFRLFNPDGSAASPREFTAAHRGAGEQRDLDLTALKNGGFAIAWEDSGGKSGDSSGLSVRAQAFKADGARDGDEVRVNKFALANQSDPFIAQGKNGKLLIGFGDDSRSLNGNFTDLHDRVYGAGGGGGPKGPSAGDDTLAGGAGADRINGLGGDDLIHGRGGADILRGAAGDDRLFGDLGNDKLFGNAGGDKLFGGAGNDRLVGGLGADLLNGGGGRDVMLGGGGGDRLVGRAGNDVMKGAAGDDYLNGAAGGDRLIGGFGNDVMLGGGGQDRLIGGGGRDVLNGGAGGDVMTGGGAADIFVFATGGGRDRITDFRDGVDHIKFNSGAADFQDLNVTQDGNDVLIAYDGGVIRVEDANAPDFSSDDFIF